MALWHFIPQEVFEEGLEANGIVVPVAGMASIAGGYGDGFTRRFRLRYVRVTSEECALMAEFFDRQRGAHNPFDFINPNDGLIYRVRFETDFEASLFEPVFFRTNELVFVVVDA